MTSETQANLSLREALRRYVEARHQALLAARRTLGINELDARALLFIADNPGVRPGRLREYLGITSAGVTTLIDRLVQRGAVRRDIDEDDRRVNHISIIVDLGEEPWSALTRFDREFDGALDPSDAEDHERFASVLDSLTSHATSAFH